MIWLRNLFHKRPISVREAGRRGAIARNRKAKEPILRRCQQIREELGMPFDPRLGGSA